MIRVNELLEFSRFDKSVGAKESSNIDKDSEFKKYCHPYVDMSQ